MSEHLLEGHARFRAVTSGRERAFLQHLASEGQSPDTLFVGCCDSRVVPEILTHSSPGALFVVRNVANIVPTFAHADDSVGAAVEYSVGFLAVRHVIVCGHYGCGGVKAAVARLDPVRGYPSLRAWLHQALEPVDRVRAKHDTADEDAQWKRAVEENVIQQMANLTTYPVVADAIERQALEIHGWIYDIHDLALRIYDSEDKAFVAA